MQVFIGKILEGEKVIIEGQEAKHCAKVLRKKVGDRVHIIDGKGSLCHVEIIEIKKDACICSILDYQLQKESKTKIHIAISPTKQNARIEFFMEKAVELGVHEITLIQSSRSERKSIKRERLLKICIAASKQSLRASFPSVNEMITFKSFVNKPFEGYQKLICYVGEKEILLEEVLIPGKSAIILVGPEGGFSDDEIKLAENAGWKSVSLGAQRLRTETAGIYAATAFQILKNRSQN